MAILEWAGKSKVIGHHRDVKYKTLERKYSFNENGQYTENINSENMIIHGDNLEALKSLLPKYQGKIKCIYIDPPYNTGEEKWIYNDNVNDPRINKWIGEVVKKEGEDLSRHDKWLCMMYPRLKLLEKLLSPDGAIFISIDDNEQYHLRSICNEIFGSSNFVATFIWEKRKNRENRKEISTRHDYILCYAKSKGTQERIIKLLPMTGEALERYQNVDNDPRGLWKSDPATAQAGHATASQFYTLVAPNGKRHELPKGRCWLYTQDVMQEAIEDGRIWFGKDGNNTPRIKTYLTAKERGLTPETIWFADDVSTNEEAKKCLKRIFSEEIPFETPKPYELIERIIELVTDNDSIILDSFAGSGTTAHAVLNMNKKVGNRKFILVEMMDYAESITAERVKRVISGYDATFTEEEVIYEKQLTIKNITSAAEFIGEAEKVIEENKDKYTKIGKVSLKNDYIRVVAKNEYKGHVDGIGGSFSYYELGHELFSEDGLINSDITEEQLREYVYFSETKGAILAEDSQKDNKYYLGTNGNSAYYLYFEKDKTTTLNHEFLATIKKEAEAYIVYADKCIIDSKSLRRNNITFKKIPRDVIRF